MRRSGRHHTSVTPSWWFIVCQGVQGLVLLTTSSVNRAAYGFARRAPFSSRLMYSRHAIDGPIKISMEASPGLPNDVFRLVRLRDSVELQTAMYRLTPAKVDSPAEIVLVSMVHVADQPYYREIMRNASLYDRVLFELIVGSGVSRLDAGGRKAVVDYVYPTREQELLARNYRLAPQLHCLNYCHLCKERVGDGRIPRWVLADLSRGEIQELQKAAGEKAVGHSGWRNVLDEVTRALVVGRQAGDKILPKFFPPLGSSLNKAAVILRTLLWLAPCPEAEIMLLDWARSYPRAGGLSALAPLIAERVLAGDFFTARKLGFAQQMVSGQAGGGDWGASDDVIVKARNGVVVDEVQRALEEGCRSIMITYGALHMQDLTSQLCERLDASAETAGWRTAWVVPVKPKKAEPNKTVAIAMSRGSKSESPSRSGLGPAAIAVGVTLYTQHFFLNNSYDTSLGYWASCLTPVNLGALEKLKRISGSAGRDDGNVGELGDEPSDGATGWGPIVVAALAYVAVGAWDWTDTVEALARESREVAMDGPSVEGIGSTLLVAVLYVARHAYLYYGLARWLVQWDKRLF